MTPLDPILPAIARWHSAVEAHLAVRRRAILKWPHDPMRAEEVANRAAWPARERTLRTVYDTTPTTLAGLAALAEVFYAEEYGILDGDEVARGLLNILRSIAKLAAKPQAEEDLVWPRLRKIPVFA